ncbi:hypothetical protein BGZ65_008124 [Modicella reniformis]|uniref:Major facilitator superfamily (MFS) profile domain-containing protein n=1 Tax=Modicella reniformis TaxID=1440133 RepID=A0A9P6LS27_9FUNG|nr:hypothetical protein BGZ65_008124 [Modicella reniformis]
MPNDVSGNAKVAGIVQDINLTQNEFSWALSIFFFGYVLFEVPSNICLKLIGPKKWVSFIMLLWGGIMMAMAAVRNASDLMAARFFLGVTECGLFPGVVYLFSLWYTKEEQALRNGIFFSSATMAGAFGGILAYGIEHMDGFGGLHGWQWIFILEGLPTVLLTIVVYLYLPDFPETAWFLNNEEKELAIRRLRIDAGPATQTEFSWNQCRLAFTDWKVHMHMIIYFCHTTALFAFALFMPSIVVGFHFDRVTTQIMTAPAYAVACFATIYCAFSSDRSKERGFHLAAAGAIACLGYILLIVTRNSSTIVRYICLTITASGNFSTLPPMVSWVSSNIGGHTKRGVATAIIISFANSGGAISGHVYKDDDALQGYVRGHTICAILSGTLVIFTLALKWLLTRENNRRDRLTPEEFEAEAEGEDLCDFHPGWRYWT